MQNGVMIQYFHWYTPGGVLWKEVKEKAKYLSEIGITAAWLPPAFKASAGSPSVGYDVYDLYDLGEFEQKGTLATKYGTKQEYLGAIEALHQNGVQAIADIVLNHKAGGDEKEAVMAIVVDENDRNKPIDEPHEIEAFTKFHFAGRNKKYSEFEWNFQCFTGTDYDARTETSGIFKFVSEYGNDWQQMISDEKGNYDYLMFCDVDFRNPALLSELDGWGAWYVNETHVDGVRLDAVKHISPEFYKNWLGNLRTNVQKEIFAVGEYWAPGELALLITYLEATDYTMSLFDSALHHNLHRASTSGSDFNMSTILDNSLMLSKPAFAVTLVDNHDTQPLQALAAPVEHWFKPLAYALILLREEGYPCVFYPDLYGAQYTDKGDDGNDHEIFLNRVDEIEALLFARQNYAYGEQRVYFDHENCIGFTRGGDEEHAGLAVLMSNGDGGEKMMEVGAAYAGKNFKDLLGKVEQNVTIGEDGSGIFTCNAGSVSVWVVAED